MSRYIDITDLKEMFFLETAAAKTAVSCEQCGKCGSVCIAPFKKPNPTSLIRLVQLGQVAEALQSPLLWSCIGCEQCNMACPNRLNVAHLVRSLRRLSARERDVCFPKYIFDLFVE